MRRNTVGDLWPEDFPPAYFFAEQKDSSCFTVVAFVFAENLH